MPKTKSQQPTATTSAPTPAPTPTPTAARPHAAWHVRFPGATPDPVTVEHAWSQHPEDLHIVGAGSRDVVHGRWGHKLYYTWEEAITASIEQQQAKIRQLEAEQAAAHVQLDRLRSLTEPDPEPQPDSPPQPQD